MNGLEISFPDPKSCRRCKKDFVEGDAVVPIYTPAKGRKRLTMDWATGKRTNTGERYYLNGDAIGSTAWYHHKCVPPNLWKKLSLSGRPGPATPVSS